jgi:hypothetical protein
MARPSTTKVLKALVEDGCVSKFRRVREFDDLRQVHATFYRVTSERVRTEHEIYGRDARMYFRCTDTEGTQRVLAVLDTLGVKVNHRWGGENPNCFEIRVSYFKGPRWWE